MFQQFKNIDSAFKYIRFFSLLFLMGNIIIYCFYSYNFGQALKAGQKRIYILTNGKLMDAYSVDRSDSLNVEISDHVTVFHNRFYSLEPDEELNKKHITAALYLADNTARQEYENLSESGYYSNIISGNISQKVEDPDSIFVDINKNPYYFKYYGKIKIIRSTSITTRSLVTDGVIRVISISTKNPHGFLIEKWKILQNKDLSIEKR
jgi:conjugative transposon TraK protein